MLTTTKQITLYVEELQQVKQHKVIGVVVDEIYNGRNMLIVFSRNYLKLWRCFVVSNISYPMIKVNDLPCPYCILSITV